MSSAASPRRRCCINSAAGDCEEIRRFLSERLQVTGEVLDEHYFAWEDCRSLAAGQFGEEEIEQLEKGGSDAIICALGAMIQYLTQTQKHGLESLTHLEVYSDDQYMTLDLTARRNLELTKTLRTGERRGTLLWVLDQTRTPMGKRLIRSVLEKPLLNPTAINKRLNAVGELLGDSIRLDNIREILKDIFDMGAADHPASSTARLPRGRCARCSPPLKSCRSSSRRWER